MPRSRAREIEQLAALLDGARAPADVDREVRRLGTLATAVIDHDPVPAVALTDDRRAAMRARLLDDIADLDRAPAATTRAFTPARDRVAGAARSARMGLATGLAAAMVGTTGMAFAAQEALPGDALYRLKQVTESTRLSLASDTVDQGRLQLRFAEERLDEVVAGHDRIGNARLATTFQEMDERSLEGARALLAEAERTGEGRLIVEVDAFTQRQAGRIVDVYGDLPPAVRPHAEDALGVLRHIRLELLFPVARLCDCVELAAGGVTPIAEGASLTDRLRSAALPPATPSSELARLADGLSETDAAAVERVERAVDHGDDDAETSGPSTVGGATTGAGETIGTQTGRIGDAVGSTTREVGRVIDDTTGSGVGGAVGGVGEDVGGVVDAVGDTVGGVVRDPGKVIRDPGGTVGGAVDDVVDGAGDVVGGVGDAVGGVGGVGDTVGGVTGGVRDRLGGLGGG